MLYPVHLPIAMAFVGVSWISFEVGFGIKSASGLLIWLNCLINRR
jgi:hypothetical protein